MADEVDIASKIIDDELRYALNEMRRNIPSGKRGPECCMECEEPMPEVRRELGLSLCVPCAQEKERRAALFAG